VVMALSGGGGPIGHNHRVSNSSLSSHGVSTELDQMPRLLILQNVLSNFSQSLPIIKY
jgi:hypothetical protein